MYRHITALALFACLAGADLSADAFAAIKCWINKDGVRECGDVVPPEHAQKEIHTINPRGIVVDVRPRAKTPEEVEQERQEKLLEDTRLAEEKRLREIADARDRLLLSTFSTETEMQAARDRALESIDGLISVNHAMILQLDRKLDELKKNAARLERAGKEIPDELKSEMEDLERQIVDKQDFIASQEREKDKVRENHSADLRRYRELKKTAP